MIQTGRQQREACSSARAQSCYPRLLAGVSIGALLLGLTANPAAAQLARMRAAAGTVSTPSAATSTTATPVRPATMQDALARQQALQTRAKALAGYVTSAKSAALASIQGTPTNGISTGGLNPIQAVRAATIFVAAGVDPATVSANVAPASVAAASDASGINTWDGAKAPVQSTAGTGKVTVSITQTQQNAVLSWQNFDVGANTALVFDQKQNGVAQPGWTVVNRVVNSVAPSKIFGSITADGAVLILNRSGVLFGPGAQVNLHSLIASSLDIGNFASSVVSVGQTQFFVASSIKDRNAGFLQNGLLVQGLTGYKGQYLSSVLPAGQYNVNLALPQSVAPEGDVAVYSGATITAGDGGQIILAGPTAINAGVLSATNGQVSLQGGRFIGAVTSTGAAGSVDPDVRGIILSSQVPSQPTTPQDPTPDQGVVENDGLIDSRRGYISLGTAPFGTVTNTGLLQATTSVSRNGKIALTAGIVTLSGSNDPTMASGIQITPDDNGETVPQGTANSPPSFKTSHIVIGDTITGYLSADTANDIALLPSTFNMGRNAFILAPSANIVIGHDVASGDFLQQTAINAAVNIADGAEIDVSGMMAVPLSAAVNTVQISPAKQNELRDTPNYRAVSTDGSFTLNGQTLYVDARESGVRPDGVAWVGSPLIEAASAVSQIPVTAAELMTKGGTISIDVGALSGSANLDAARVAAIKIDKGAIFDISGGWVTYAAGAVLTSELITSDGRIVNIGDADENDDFVGVVDGFTETQSHFGISETYRNAALQGVKYYSAYDEGRDAGALQIVGTNIAFAGAVYAHGFAGANQIGAALVPTAASSIAGDPRKLQSSKYQLPSGGLFRIGSFSGSSGIGLGQDIVVYHGTVGAGAANPAEVLLDDTMLSSAGLSGLVLQTSGAVTLAAAGDAILQDPAALKLTGDSSLTLADGGVLEIDAGRSIRLDGAVNIAGGRIAARTYQLTDVLATGVGTVGNPFRSDDDIGAVYAPDAALPNLFDVTVKGMLSVAGRWANDYLDPLDPQGAGWIDGGAISLTVAPKVFVPLGASVATATVAGDLSGSIRIDPGALLDVSAGGYISPARKIALTASGGSVSLIDETTYATVNPVLNNLPEAAGTTAFGQTVAFTPAIATPTTIGVIPTLTPVEQNSVVQFATGSIRGFGFSGGGTFKLVAPDIAVGAGGDADATVIPLDFLQKTGFATLDLTAYHARIVPTLFDNGSTALSTFFDTTRVVIGAGQQLDLTQVMLPTVLDIATQTTLFNLASGANVASLLTATVPTSTWFQKAANLQLHGLMELDVEAGGAIVGAPQASIITPKLYNAGTITLPGGTIQQIATLPPVLNAAGVGLTDASFGGTGFAAVFGAADALGRYAEDARNTAGLTNADGSLQTNNQIFTTPGGEHFLYFLGQLGADDGIVLSHGSTTDLSGTALFDPNAPFRADGTQYRFGRLIAGGSITTAAALNPNNDATQALFANPAYGFTTYPDPTSTSPTPPPLLEQTAARALVAQPGARIDISGVNAMLDEPVSSTDYAPSLQWSDAGAIALNGGGTLSGAAIDAHGGAAQATGGTLTWRDPVIRATDDRSGAANVAYADQIAASGFSTLIANGGLTLDGHFTLALNKALLVQSSPSIDGTPIGSNAAVTISATQGTDATIAAPYISFSSRSGAGLSPNPVSGNAVVTFSAGASGMDVFGSIQFDASIAQTNLDSVADVRLIGVDDRTDLTLLPVLNGGLFSAGNLTFDAGRVYTTTGTGNLQRILEDAAGAADTHPPSPYLLQALGTSTITFLGDHINTAIPLSAGSYLQIQANTVVQNGYLAAPLGEIQFGTAANPIGSISFGAGGVTVVSAAGQAIPYGTTTDLTQYFFTPGTSSPITQLPSGSLSITASNIDVAKGGTIVGSGGGDVFAYEFVSGTGGSRDVLSRFNTDEFSSNGYNPATGSGYQYADQRQVYAIVPAAEAAKVALLDPVYSADYGASGPTNLYGTSAGLSVTLDGGAGIAAGQYVLMPAHYALLPGAYRIVRNSGSTAPAPGAVQTLRDGSIVMGGTFSTAGTDLAGSQRQSFTIQARSSFLKYSNIQTTSGTTTVTKAASEAGIAVPRLPLDAARVVLDPLKSLAVASLFDMTPATGGRGSEVDILGTDILINTSGVNPDFGLVLSEKTLGNLNANSLMIGGTRIENTDDTTRLGITAHRIVVGDNITITAPELILAVAGVASRIDVHDGATLSATGTLADTRAGDYIITSTNTPATGDPFDETGIGSVLRVSNGVQRSVDRQGAAAVSNANRNSQLNVLAATLSGQSLLLDTNRNFSVAADATLNAPNITLGATNISFGAAGSISATLEQQLAAATNLTLASSAAIMFDPDTTHTFHNLSIDAPGIALTSKTRGLQTLVINADAVRIANSNASTITSCSGTGAFGCGLGGKTLAINASSLTFGSGTVYTYNFDGSVTLAATNGAYVEGKGQLDLGGAALVMKTPFVVDRAAVIDPNRASPTAVDAITPAGNYTIPVTPDYLFATNGALTLVAPALANGAAAPAPAGLRAPGAHIAFGTGAAPLKSATIDGVAVTATSGVIDVESQGSVTLAGAAVLATPGYSRSFGDAQSTTTVSAGAGTVNLVSLKGDIILPATSAIIVDSGVGNAGALNVLAAEGAITFDATLDAGVKGTRNASLTLDTQHSGFDLDGFATRYGALFRGDLTIRAGTGDLGLAAGHVLSASSVNLTADGGVVDIGGTITTAGVDIRGLSVGDVNAARADGGNIGLWGMNGVTLAAGSLLDTHTLGYADTDLRQASAGDVTIGIGDAGGAIVIDAGATINVAATRTQAALAAGTTGNRLVAQTVKDPNTLVNTTAYQLVGADTGGTVSLRAPLIGEALDLVDVRLHGTIAGAKSTEVEAYRTFNLDQIAAGGLFDGVYSTGVAIALDATPTGYSFLGDSFTYGDGLDSLPYILQHFSAAAVDGSSFSGIRVRPGVDLVSSGSITLVSAWNLAAGTLDTAGALTAGLLKPLPELGVRADGSAYDGTPYYAVVAGQEGNLLANYTSFLYRVGGKATGEAPVINLHSGGTLDIAGSISDGFFTFADKSDPAYINYQLGGGDRTYDPALLLSCGTGLNCGTVASYNDVAGGTVAAAAGNTATITLNRFFTGNQEGAVYIDAPYSDAANSAAALGSGFDPNTGLPGGDALGFAQLFPLLPDGTAMHSSSLRLVGGAGATISANPLHVDRATAANVIVEGETAYSLTASPGSYRIGSSIDLKLALNGLVNNAGPSYSLDALLGSSDSNGNVNALDDDSYTSITWGASDVGLAADLRGEAIAFFAGKSATFARGGRGIATGVAAPLGEMLAFLQSITPNFLAQSASANFGYPTATLAVPPVINFGNATAHVRTVIRTGDGAIAVASAGDIDLRNGAAATYRNANGGTTSARNSAGAQVGGTAIYTAGQRLSAAAVAANIVGSGALVSVAPDSPYLGIPAGSDSVLPSPKGFDDQAGVLAENGGAVSLVAGGDVLGRRDVWSERFLGSGSTYASTKITGFLDTQIGDASQRWRPGSVGQDTEIAIAPKYFTSGIGALAGGDVTITAGGSVSDLTIALDSAVTTTDTGAGAVERVVGHGNLAAVIGGDLRAGQIDVAEGTGRIAVSGSVTGFGTQPGSTTADQTQYLRVRVADANVSLGANGSIALAGVSALGAARGDSPIDEYNQAGFFTANAGFSAVATGGLTYVGNRVEQTVPFQIDAGNSGVFGGAVLPPSLTLAALTGNLRAPTLPMLLYPSATGNLELFSAGNIDSLIVAMSDSDPSLLPGAFSAAQINIDSVSGTGAGNVTALVGLGFGIPGAQPTTSDYLLRLYHNQTATHAGDTTPIKIFAGNDISASLINVPKQAEIIAGRDIVNLFFTGQNNNVQDTTLISAGRDIVGTTTSSTTANLPYIVSSNYVVGGPGGFVVSAGRNIGPFLNSAVVDNISYGGGIQTNGNFYNPWLGAQGADLTVLFGVANGIDYAAATTTYLDPAGFANLDGALFVQTTDAAGNKHPDRSKQIYAPILAAWLRGNAPAAFAAIFGTAAYPDTAAGNAALTASSYAQSATMYAAFQKLDALLQDKFLINSVYFNELRQAAIPGSPSYLQYVRGYRAIDTLFPARLGYTDNLSVYTIDPATKSADHPQGIATRNLVDGQPEKAKQVSTGNADLRLATFQTALGGDLSIVGPGGNFVAGSVVRTSTQAAQRVTRFGVDPTSSLAFGQLANANIRRINAIPIGYEGVLTLNGGAIDAFTDGNFLVNQSRIFTEAGGDITMWSSNGDLNAGQGPRSASNFPPVTVRFDLDGYSQNDSAGSVSGAGIGAFQRSPGDPASSVILIAPAGLVDAGDAGVRASGDVLVAAARVANADAFSAGGTIAGVPARAATPAAAAPTSATSAIAAQARNTGNATSGDRRSIITVDVLGFAGSQSACDDPASTDPDCRKSGK